MTQGIIYTFKEIKIATSRGSSLPAKVAVFGRGSVVSFERVASRFPSATGTWTTGPQPEDWQAEQLKRAIVSAFTRNQLPGAGNDELLQLMELCAVVVARAGGVLPPGTPAASDPRPGGPSRAHS